MYLLYFYVPESHKDIVKEAVFTAGAGRYDGYDCCSWEVEGTGQFRPLEGSNPFIGSTDTIEQVKEFRIEMICTKESIKKVVEALIEAHPYEEPAYGITEIFTKNDLP